MRIVTSAAIILGILFLATACRAEGDVVPRLDFEEQQGEGAPTGWGGGPEGTITADSLTVHSGKWAARVERDANSARKFSSLTTHLPVDFTGKTIELRGWLRLEDVDGYAALWLREDDRNNSVAFDNMRNQRLSGTIDWVEYSIVLPLEEAAETVYFGILLSGTGTVWADDVQLLVDGVPFDKAPRLERAPTIFDRDDRFDGGSETTDIDALSEFQIDNLVRLGKVWGYLKYHHPGIVGGAFHWDYELLDILPHVLAATDAARANELIVELIDSLDEVPACDECAPLPTGCHLLPRLGWIRDAGRLGAPVSDRLQDIHTKRPAVDEQFFVSLHPGAGNADFSIEPNYRDLVFPDHGFQILGLLRLWNIVEYWFPYRDRIDGDWDEVLAEFLPRVVAAPDKDAWALEMMALIARITDTHANLWSSLALRPPVGDHRLPVVFRFIEGEPMVTQFAHNELGPACGLEIGDVLLSIDGETIVDLVEQWRPLYAASNEPTRLRDIGHNLSRGPAGECVLGIRRGDEEIEVRTERVPLDEIDRGVGRRHSLPGETCRLLGDDVAYLSLASVKTDEIDEYLETAADTRGLVIDIRNYPSEFVVFALGSRLVSDPTSFAVFTCPDVNNPGAFTWTQAMVLNPAAPRYEGKIVILVDETSQSQAEYTAMSLRAGPGAIVVGSTTAGADGNVSTIPLPGGLHTMISGLGIFYPDHTPTQRYGIIPDVEVRPTQEGIRAGRDEVLEEAMRLIRAN